ncbi:hypothetical protein [Lysobacter claricitrinus]|uniref:hypothetical protein n=1 Tax=Lysobacter claricitrinus TaxID=3367728 RepID=UPI0037DBAD01
MAPRNAALVAALLIAVTAAPAAGAERQVETLYKKARDMPGCSDRWATDKVVAECRQIIAAYRAAEAASDATPDDLEFLVVKRLQQQAILAWALREREGDVAGARRELDAAFKDLDQLAPGNTNAFARVQTLDLLRQTALLELDGGSSDRADAAIAEYRKHSQGFLGALEQLRDNTKAMNQERLNAVDAANFEMELGEHYIAMLEKYGATDKDATRAKAVEALERTRQWAIARADNKWNGFAEKSPAVMYADASLRLARLAHEAHDADALAKYVGEGKAVACVDPSGNDPYNDSELQERCLGTMLMEGWVTGANQALMRKISQQQDEQWRAVVEMLRKKE